MAQDLSRGLGECLQMLLDIEEQLERLAAMILRDDAPPDALEPLHAISVQILIDTIKWIGGRYV